MIIAIDTGGTKTAVASFSKTGAPLQFTKFPTPKNKSQYIAEVAHAVSCLSNGRKIDAISVALPGIIKNDVALWCKNLGWKNFDVTSRLRKFFPDVPIFVENDANLAGLSEAILQRQGDKRVLYITISTGIGTGFAQNGQIVDYLRLSEGGQMLIYKDSKPQKWEEFASGRAIYEKYGKLGSEIKDQSTWNEIAESLAMGLVALIPLTQPDVIIFGGSVGAYTNKFARHLTTVLDKSLPPHISRPELKRAAHPEQAVLYGGYQYAVRRLSDRAD